MNRHSSSELVLAQQPCIHTYHISTIYVYTSKSSIFFCLCLLVEHLWARNHSGSSATLPLPRAIPSDSAQPALPALAWIDRNTTPGGAFDHPQAWRHGGTGIWYASHGNKSLGRQSLAMISRQHHMIEASTNHVESNQLRTPQFFLKLSMMVYFNDSSTNFKPRGHRYKMDLHGSSRILQKTIARRVQKTMSSCLDRGFQGGLESSSHVNAYSKNISSLENSPFT